MGSTIAVYLKFFGLIYINASLGLSGCADLGSDLGAHFLRMILQKIVRSERVLKRFTCVSRLITLIFTVEAGVILKMFK